MVQGGSKLGLLYGIMYYVKQDVWDALHFLPLGMLVGIPIACFWYAGIRKTRKEEKRKWLLPMLIVFSVFCVSLVSITFFSRGSGSREGVSLKIFSTWGKNDRNHAYVVENVLLFIPYGVLLPIVFPKATKFGRSCFIGLVTSFVIEVAQWITKRGYFQTDDILTNLLGTTIGFGLFFLGKSGIQRVQSLLVKLFQKKNIVTEGHKNE